MTDTTTNETPAPYKIDNIQKATVNGQKVKLFKVWRYAPDANAYIFQGQYSVPQRTANKNINTLYASGDVFRSSHA
jgi:hypothetical protein